MEDGLNSVTLNNNQDFDVVEVYSDNTLKCVATQEISDKFNQLPDYVRDSIISDFHSDGAKRDSGFVCSCDDLFRISLDYEYQKIQSQFLFVKIIQLRTF